MGRYSSGSILVEPCKLIFYGAHTAVAKVYCLYLSPKKKITLSNFLPKNTSLIGGIRKYELDSTDNDCYSLLATTLFGKQCEPGITLVGELLKAVSII